MTKEELFAYCLEAYGTTPDHPFRDDLETAVLRHEDSGKWYALVMRVSARRFGKESDERISVVNLKQPLEVCGSFSEKDGVYPAYHMNKLHWISVLLSEVSEEVLRFLLHASYTSTQRKKPPRKAFSRKAH